MYVRVLVSSNNNSMPPSLMNIDQDREGLCENHLTNMGQVDSTLSGYIGFSHKVALLIVFVRHHAYLIMSDMC